MLLENDLVFEFCVLDIETTGLDPILDDILEINIISIVGSDDPFELEFHTYVKPRKSIPLFVTALNGITNQMTSNGKPQIEAAELARAIIGNKIVIGHNIKFDLSFLKERHRGFCNVKFIDTLAIAKDKLVLPSYSQVELESYYGVSNNARHTAKGDTKALLEIIRKMQSDGIDIERYISK